MIHKKLVGRVFQLDKHLGTDYRYESIRIECEADTFEEAIKEVENDFQDYVALKKKELKVKELNEEPFETKAKEIVNNNPLIMKKV